MSKEKLTNRGILHPNDRKESDRHPDLKGKINVNGVDHYLSAWWSENEHGRFLRLSLGDEVKARREEPRRQERRSPPYSGDEDLSF